MRFMAALKSIDKDELRRGIGWFCLGCLALALLTPIGIWVGVHVATAGMVYMAVIVLLSMTGHVICTVVLALIASACLNYFFTEPLFSFEIARPEDVIPIVAFVLVAIMLAPVLKRLRRLGVQAALRDQLQLIIDTIPAVVWSSLPDGSTEFLNQRFRDYSGVAAEAGPGLAWIEILHPDDRTGGHWEAAFAAGEPFEREARMRAANADYRRFLLRFVPLRDSQGAVAKWYATSTDIEDLKRAEEELRQREAYLREVQTELAHVNRVTTAGQLAASIAHEVAQPVAASVTNANAALRWLRAKPPNLDETQNALDRIVRDGRRASDILGRIRALVRKAPPRRDQLNINEMILEVLALTRAELRRARIVGRTQLTDGLPPVEGDRVQLQQVMLNLVLNAIEAMAGVADERELLIATEPDADGAVRVAVRDSGPGLSADGLAHVFDPFYTTKSGGMGMGLAICQSIVETHGGRIWASANGSRGAVFQFILPREIVMAA
jgi:PAS domain S-box-containing protein